MSSESPARRAASAHASAPGTGRSRPSSASSPIAAWSRSRFGVDLPRRRQHRERDRDVEARALLAQVGRREVDGDSTERPFELGARDTAPDALLRLLARLVGKTDDRERRHAALQVCLDLDRPCVESDEGMRERLGEHDSTLRRQNARIARVLSHLRESSRLSAVDAYLAIASKRDARAYSSLAHSGRRARSDPRCGTARGKREKPSALEAHRRRGHCPQGASGRHRLRAAERPWRHPRRRPQRERTGSDRVRLWPRCPEHDARGLERRRGLVPERDSRRRRCRDGARSRPRTIACRS